MLENDNKQKCKATISVSYQSNLAGKQKRGGML